METSPVPCLGLSLRAPAQEASWGVHGRGFRKEPGHEYLSGVSWGGEPSDFSFSQELWLYSALLYEIKEQEDLLGSVTSFLPEQLRV